MISYFPWARPEPLISALHGSRSKQIVLSGNHVPKELVLVMRPHRVNYGNESKPRSLSQYCFHTKELILGVHQNSWFRECLYQRGNLRHPSKPRSWSRECIKTNKLVPVMHQNQGVDPGSVSKSVSSYQAWTNFCKQLPSTGWYFQQLSSHETDTCPTALPVIVFVLKLWTIFLSCLGVVRT